MSPRLLRPIASQQAGGTPVNASLLLHFDGNYSDSSPDNRALSTVGAVDFSSTEKKFGSGSVYFPSAATAWVEIDDDPPLLDSQDFTMECWLYLESLGPGGASQIFGRHEACVGASPLLAAWNSTGVMYFEPGAIFGVNPIPTEEWVHLAVVRSGAAITMYMNGLVEASGGISGSINDYSYPFRIGGTDGCGYGSGIQGYIDDFRMVKGLAVYTGPFIPPSAPLSPYATPVPVSREASLLLHFDGNFNDSSPNNLAVTAEGSADIDQTIVKFGTHSAYFDGDGGYLTIAELELVNTDFTIEAWVYFTNLAGEQAVVENYVDGVGFALIKISDQNSNDGNKFFFTGGDSAGTIYGGGDAVRAGINQWHHVAVSRNGNTTRLFVDGVLQASGDVPVPAASGPTVAVGARLNGSNFFNGYIDELRITKAALYCDSFTAPTSPPTPTVIPPTCPPPPCDPYGTYLREECQGCDYGTVYADGDCGEYFDAYSPGDCC